MSDWYTESKKPISGKVGKLIEQSRKDNILCNSKMIQESERIGGICNKIVTDDFFLTELGKLNDFANGWAGDEKYLKYDEKSGMATHLKVKGSFDIELTDSKQIHIWTKGYHQAVHELHDRITKLELLYRVQQHQKTKQTLGSTGDNNA